MTVKEFLLNKTEVGELCVIRDYGYIIMTAWIDCEDLFAINENVGNREVESDSYGMLPIHNLYGSNIDVPCHYIDIR